MQKGRGVVWRDTEGAAGGQEPLAPATWVSTPPLFPPGCPGPQEGRGRSGQEGCSLQHEPACLHSAPTEWESGAGPGRQDRRRGEAAAQGNRAARRPQYGEIPRALRRGWCCRCPVGGGCGVCRPGTWTCGLNEGEMGRAGWDKRYTLRGLDGILGTRPL